MNEKFIDRFNVGVVPRGDSSSRRQDIHSW